MNLPIAIRPASIQDYRYCYSLTKKNMLEYFTKYWGGWNPAVFRRDFIPQEAQIILLNNKRVGFYVLKLHTDYIHLDNIQLNSQVRGKGIGSYIMQQIEKDAVRQNRTILRLQVFNDNPAKKLYERLGYKVIQEKGSSVVMEKILPIR